jgi:pimeloyl-ACP methyl ester carboxylesterase
MILNYKGAEVFYSLYGSGEPVVLIHGFLENSTMWDALIPKLSETHQVITVDLLGHGKTDCLGYIHSMNDFAEVILNLLDFLNIKTCKFIGHSLGGYVALAIAKINTIEITGVCLLNSTTKKDDNTRRLLRTRAIKNAKRHYESLVSMSISNLFYEENRQRYKQEINDVKSEALKTPVQGYIAAQEGMMQRLDLTDFFRDATFKKAIIAGRQDAVISHEELQSIALYTRAPFYELDGGHMSHVESLKGLKSLLTEFIKN